MKLSIISYYTIIALTLLVTACEQNDLSTSQSDKFIKVYGIGTENQINDVVNTGNGSILIGSSGNGIDETNIMLFSTDNFGNSIWQNSSLKWSDNDIGIKILKGENDYLAAGIVSETEEENNLLLFAFNEEGDTLWSSIYDTVNIASITDACTDTAGNYYISAAINNNEATNSCVIFKTNHTGEFIWLRQFSGSIHSLIFRNNVIYFSGLNTSLTSNIQKSIRIGTINTSGITLDHHLFTESQNFKQTRLSATDNKFVVSASYTSSNNEISNIQFASFHPDNIHSTIDTLKYIYEGILDANDMNAQGGDIIIGCTETGVTNSVKLLRLNNNTTVTELFSLNSINNIQCKAINIESNIIYIAGNSKNDNHSEGIFIKYNPLVW